MCGIAHLRISLAFAADLRPRPVPCPDRNVQARRAAIAIAVHIALDPLQEGRRDLRREEVGCADPERARIDSRPQPAGLRPGGAVRGERPGGQARERPPDPATGGDRPTTAGGPATRTGKTPTVPSSAAIEAASGAPSRDSTTRRTSGRSWSTTTR